MKNKRLIIISLVILAGLIIAGVFYFDGEEKDISHLREYYQELAKECEGKYINYDCCIDSLMGMAENNYKLEPEEGCPEGYIRNTLRCPGSFIWCEEEVIIIIEINKKEYNLGEMIEIMIKNEGDISIWYDKYSSFPSCCALYKWEDDEWETLGVPFDVIQIVPPLGGGSRRIVFEELKPGEIFQKEWNMKIGEWSENYVEPGDYKFSFYYKLDENSLDAKVIYSDSFIIKK